MNELIRENWLDVICFASLLTLLFVSYPCTECPEEAVFSVTK